MIKTGLAWRRHRGVFPLQPPCRIRHAPVFLGESCARQPVHRGIDLLHLIRCDARGTPKFTGFIRVNLAHDEPVGLLQRVYILLLVRPNHDAIHSEGQHALDRAAIHVVPDFHPRIIAVNLWQVVKGEVVLFGCGIAVHGFQKGDRKFGRVRPIVEGIPRARLRRRWGYPLQVSGQIAISRHGNLEIPGKVIENTGHIGGALNIGMATQRIHAAASPSDVAHQKLQHRRGAYDLRAEGVLGPSDRVDDGCHFFKVAIFADRSEKISRLQELRPRDAGDAFDDFGRVARVVLFRELQDASRMLQHEIVSDVGRQRRWRRCGQRIALSRFSRHLATWLVIPRGLVVGFGRFIKSGIEAVLRQLEAFLNQEGRIRVINEVFLGNAVVLERVVDQTAQKGDVCAGANLQKQISSGSCAGKPRINHDQFGITIPFGFDGPLEAAWVVLGWITTHNQHQVGVLDVDPAIGHCPASEGRSQT